MTNLNPTLDFQILETYDPRIISVIDNSNWGAIENKPAIMQVTIPGYEDCIVYNFEKGRVNIYNSVNLRVNCPTGNCDGIVLIDLPDGIYTFTLVGSPDTYSVTKKFLKTSSIQLELDAIYLTTDSYEQVEQVEQYLRLAEAALRQGNIEIASVMFQKASKKIANLKQCC